MMCLWVMGGECHLYGHTICSLCPNDVERVTPNGVPMAMPRGSHAEFAPSLGRSLHPAADQPQ